MNRTRGEIGTILSILSLVVIAGGVAMGNYISTRLSSRVTTSSHAQTPTSCRFRTDIRIYKEKRDSDADIMTTADFPKPLSAQTNRNTYLDLLTGTKLENDLIIPNLILDSGLPGTFKKNEEAWVELEGKPDAQGNTAGLNGTGWYVKEEFCYNNPRTDGTLPVQGCPSFKSLVYYNTRPDRKIEGFRINCGVDITYGWVLTRTKPDNTIAPTKNPNCNCVENPRTGKGACNANCSDSGRATQSCEPGPTGDSFCQTLDNNVPTSSPTSTVPTLGSTTPSPSTSPKPTSTSATTAPTGPVAGSCTCTDQPRALSGGGGGFPSKECSSGCAAGKVGQVCDTDRECQASAPTPTPEPFGIKADSIILNYDFSKNTRPVKKSIEALLIGVCNKSNLGEYAGVDISSFNPPAGLKCAWYNTYKTDKSNWISDRLGITGSTKNSELMTKDGDGNPIKPNTQYTISCLYRSDISPHLLSLRNIWNFCKPKQLTTTSGASLNFENILTDSYFTPDRFGASQGGYPLPNPTELPQSQIVVEYPYGGSFPFTAFRPGICEANETNAQKCTFFESDMKEYGSYLPQILDHSIFRTLTAIKDTTGKLVPLEIGKTYGITCQYVITISSGPFLARCPIINYTLKAFDGKTNDKLVFNDNFLRVYQNPLLSQSEGYPQMHYQDAIVRIVSTSLSTRNKACDVNGDKMCDLQDFNRCMSEYGPRTKTSTCDLTNDSHIDAEDVSLLLFR